MPEKTQAEFEDWMRKVNRCLAPLDYRDLPDMNYRDEFDCGTEPSEMAEMVREDNGLGEW